MGRDGGEKGEEGRKRRKGVKAKKGEATVINTLSPKVNEKQGKNRQSSTHQRVIYQDPLLGQEKRNTGVKSKLPYPRGVQTSISMPSN